MGRDVVAGQNKPLGIGCMYFGSLTKRTLQIILCKKVAIFVAIINMDDGSLKPSFLETPVSHDVQRVFTTSQW